MFPIGPKPLPCPPWPIGPPPKPWSPMIMPMSSNGSEAVVIVDVVAGFEVVGVAVGSVVVVELLSAANAYVAKPAQMAAIAVIESSINAVVFLSIFLHLLFA